MSALLVANDSLSFMNLADTSEATTVIGQWLLWIMFVHQVLTAMNASSWTRQSMLLLQHCPVSHPPASLCRLPSTWLCKMLRLAWPIDCCSMIASCRNHVMSAYWHLLSHWLSVLHMSHIHAHIPPLLCLLPLNNNCHYKTSARTLAGCGLPVVCKNTYLRLLIRFSLNP